MQYFNAIHCDRNISISEYKKNPFAVSPRIQQVGLRHTVAQFTALCHCWQASGAFSISVSAWVDKYIYDLSHFVFVVHFVAKRYIL